MYEKLLLLRHYYILINVIYIDQDKLDCIHFQRVVGN